LNRIGLSVHGNGHFWAWSSDSLASFPYHIEQDLPDFSGVAFDDAIPINCNMEVNILIAE
jgi:hypothetical protein